MDKNSSISPQGNILGKESAHTLLRIYSFYRVLLGSLLLFMFHSGITETTLGVTSPKIFSYTCLSYTAISTWTLISLWQKNFSPTQQQLLFQLTIDIAAITLLVNSSDKSYSSLGYLLIITVAYGGIFLNQQLSLLIAAFASIAAIGEGIVNAVTTTRGEQNLFAAGALGILLFLTALLFRFLTQKLQASQFEAIKQTAYAKHLQSLAQQIVERMNTGIIVVNKDQLPILANNAAYRLLGRPMQNEIVSLPTPIENMLRRWRDNGIHRQQLFKSSGSSKEIRVSFAALKIDQQSDTLIFLEDNRQLTQQAQQIKLASLGRLTASIAHEVRNPLGAISHAGQLLAESDNIAVADKRLTEIIANHSDRVNGIIENVLQLSRRKPSSAENFDLTVWLDKFCHDTELATHRDAKIDIKHNQTPLFATVDQSQLEQIMANLCDNGFRYSNIATGKSAIAIESGLDERSGLPFIDVIDEGTGVLPENINSLFEPFNTDSPQGTGLGLYISKELCEANEATLEYKRTKTGKSCFRICLAHDHRVDN